MSICLTIYIYIYIYIYISFREKGSNKRPLPGRLIHGRTQGPSQHRQQAAGGRKRSERDDTQWAHGAARGRVTWSRRRHGHAPGARSDAGCGGHGRGDTVVDSDKTRTQRLRSTFIYVSMATTSQEQIETKHVEEWIRKFLRGGMWENPFIPGSVSGSGVYICTKQADI